MSSTPKTQLELVNRTPSVYGEAESPSMSVAGVRECSNSLALAGGPRRGLDEDAMEVSGPGLTAGLFFPLLEI